MVFQMEAQFQQFIHSKFRENTVRILYIPYLEEIYDKVFLVVNKYGKVGLYDTEKFTLLHTYLLDLSVPMAAGISHRLEQIARKATPPPKCQRTHLVVDAVYAPDVGSVIFATTKNILQWYDLGEIESLSYGLDVFPRQKFLKLKKGQSPVSLRNKGQVETHRIFGLPSAAPFYCMEYLLGERTRLTSTGQSSIEISAKSNSKLILGDQEGIITIISVESGRKPFGKSKTRGVLHKIKSEDLERHGILKRYKAHNDPVKEIRFVSQRQLIISCSRDRKFSLFIKDFTETTEPYIISLPKGVNCFAHCDALKLIATGSNDFIVRLFNQFVMKMPQMELLGHKSPVIALEFLQVPFSDHPILISYSVDVELRAWDPVDFICLQSMYVSFPSRSCIMTSKTPEFGKKPLMIHQPHYTVPTSSSEAGHYNNNFGGHQQHNYDHNGGGGGGGSEKSNKLPKTTNSNQQKTPSSSSSSSSSLRPRGQDGFIIVVYCNSFARLDIEKDMTHWPFDFDDFIAEFEEVSTVHEKKLRDRHRAYAESKYSSKDPNVLKLNPDEIAGIEAKLDSYVQEILRVKRQADKQLRSAVYDPHKQSLAGEGTRKFLELRDRSQQAELFKKEGISMAFKSVPLYDLTPVEFSSTTTTTMTTTKEGAAGEKKRGGLPVTRLMEESGIKTVTSVTDLLTPVAKKCFVTHKLKDIDFDAAITARTADEMSELSDSLKQQLKKDRVGKTFPTDFVLEDDDEDDDDDDHHHHPHDQDHNGEEHDEEGKEEDDVPSFTSQESSKKFYTKN